MKICLIGNIKSIHVQRWGNYFSQKGHDVQFIYFSDDSSKAIKNEFSTTPFQITNISIYNLPYIHLNRKSIRKIVLGLDILSFKRFSYYLRLIHLKFVINKIKPDILHAHYLIPYGSFASKIGFHPLVLTAWGSDIIFAETKSQYKSLKNMFKKANLVHTGEKEGEKRLIELGCDSNKIFIQPWGIDINRFSPSARSEKLRKEILNDEDGCVITIVRSLEEVYDIPTFIKASSIVIKKRKDVKFLLIGEGNERINLEKLAKELGVNNNLTLMGAIPNDQLHTFPASSDIYVDTPHPTKGGGGIGVALMEAMSSGLPCIVARRPGAEAGVRDGENGYVFEGGNHEELAEKLLLLLVNDEKRKKFGEKSRAIALKIGNWENNLKLFENKYIDLIEKSNT